RYHDAWSPSKPAKLSPPSIGARFMASASRPNADQGFSGNRPYYLSRASDCEAGRRRRSSYPVSSLQSSVLVDLFYDGIHFRVVRPAARRAKNAVAPFSRRLHDLHLDLDFLALGHPKVLVEFAGLAVEST